MSILEHPELFEGLIALERRGFEPRQQKQEVAKIGKIGCVLALRPSMGIIVKCRRGPDGGARNLPAPVYDWFTEGFDTQDLKSAKELLDELT